MKALWITSLFILLSCSDDNFKKVENLSGFRVLAIQSNPVEVTNSGTVGLQLYVSDVKGGGRAISATTEACIDPGVTLGAAVSCDHDPTTVTGSYSFNTDTDSQMGAANLYTGLADQVLNVTIPAFIFTGRSERDKVNGVGYLVIFRFDVDGKKVVSYKRILATTRTTLNQHPSVSGILLNGGAIAGKPSKDDRLKVQVSAPETYTYINVDGSSEVKTENLQTAWYVSEGELDTSKASVSESVKFKSSTPTGTMLIISIVRDERGGVEFRQEVF
jgi:hypothetical protein